jgi:hypothetical protein
MPSWQAHHLRNSDDIVVTAADKANQSFPRILLQYPYPRKLWGSLPEINIRRGPVLV